MTMLSHIPPPSGESATVVAKMVAGMMIAAAYASADPASVTPVADWLNARPTTLWAAFLGAVLFVAITRGPMLDRIKRAAISFVLAYVFTDAVLLVMGWTNPAAERAVAAGFSLIIGTVIIAAVRRVEGNADVIADRTIELAAGRVLPGFTMPPGKPGDDDARK